MIYDIKKVKLSDEEWEQVDKLLNQIGLTREDCINNTVCQVLIANRIKEVTGKSVDQLLKEQEDLEK